MPSVPDIKELIRRARRSGPGRPRSEVRRLLEAELDSMADDPPSWVTLAADLNERGFHVTPQSLASMFARMKAAKPPAARPKPEPKIRTETRADSPPEPFHLPTVRPKS